MAPKRYKRYDATLGHDAHFDSVDSSAGVANAGDVVALDANGKLNANMMPTGFGDEIDSIITSEDLVAGNAVNTYDNGGVVTARKADGSTTGKEAHGFVLASTTSPAPCVLYQEGHNNACSALVGGRVYLSQVTPGLVTSTKPAATAGKIAQCLGHAVSATSMDWEAEEPTAT